jgi:hypothetical protein
MPFGWIIQKRKSIIKYLTINTGEKNVTDDELKYCSEKIVIYIKQL